MRLTPNALSNKISQLIKEGYPQKQAIAIAYSEMRIAWRDKHPAGKFPVWLEFETRGSAKPPHRGQNPISEKTAHKLRKAAPKTFMKMTDEEIKKSVKVKKNPIDGPGIVTKYISPSNVKGARIKAYRSGDQKINKTYSYPHELSGSDAHEAVAKSFMTHLGWSGTLSGAETDTGYFFVVHKVRQSSVRKNPVRSLKKKKGKYTIYTFVKGVKYWLTDGLTLNTDINKASVFSTVDEVIRMGKMLARQSDKEFYRGLTR